MNRSIILIAVVAIGCMASSCATVVHGWNHKFTTPVYIGEQSGKVFVEGKPYDIRMVVSGADVKSKTTNYYTYSATVTTTKLYFDKAVLVFPKQKYVTVEVRADDDVTVLESYLYRRDPRYAFFALNFFIGAGVGSIVDLGDNLAYDWELVAYRKYN